MATTDISRRAIIDLDALTHNLGVLRTAAPNALQMAVVKANAYGHGILPVALAAIEAGADWLGVAQTDEALELRSALDEAGGKFSGVPILAWISQNDAHWEDLLSANIDVSVSSVDILHEICQASKNLDTPARIHLEIDTGMSRGGITLGDIELLADAAHEASVQGYAEIVGVWTHLARADDLTPAGLSATADQISLYERGLAYLAEKNIHPQLRHVCATSGIFWHPEAHYDMVRAGIGIYGLSPDPSVATSKDLGLLPVMTLETSMELVKHMAQDVPVSYGGTYRTPSSRWIGLVALGYADGIPRSASSRGQVLVIHDQQAMLAPVVGRICMDQFMVDLGALIDPVDTDATSYAGSVDHSCTESAFDSDVNVSAVKGPAVRGDRVIIFGNPYESGGYAVPLADTWAEAAHTINYEIVTRIGHQVPRTYVKKGQGK